MVFFKKHSKESKIWHKTGQKLRFTTPFICFLASLGQLNAFSEENVGQNIQVNYSNTPLQYSNSQSPTYNDNTFLVQNKSNSPQEDSLFSLNVNCGDSAIIHNGIDFAEDQGYSANSAAYESDTLYFANPVYKTQRVGSSFTYNFSVPNGIYAVSLRFAELYFNTADTRVFDVSINDKKVISSLDLVKKAGLGKPYNRDFTVTVTGGNITIEFSPVINNPIINAIQIHQINTK